MRLLPSPACPADGSAGRHRFTTSHRPLVERVACWSARHRKTAVGMWLAFMAAAFIAGQFAAGSGVQQYDPGQAGTGEQVLTNLGVVTPPAESVLIEARTDEKHLAADAESGYRQAAAQVKRVTIEVEAALAALPQAASDIRAPFAAGRQPPGWSRPTEPPP